jgi:hypothetical protein
MQTKTAEMLARCILTSLGKQLHLVDLIGECSWHFDTHAGRLSFGHDVHWQAQILGTESFQNNSWLWAWANSGSNLSPALIQASLQMKQLGEQQQIPELIEPQISLTDEINGNVLSMIANGICNADAYYRGPYDGGAAFLLIKDTAFPRSSKSPLACIAHDFPQAISAISISDHRLALTSYLDQCGIAYTVKGNAVIAKEGDEPVLTAMFDELNRLTKLDVKMRPSTSK